MTYAEQLAERLAACVGPDCSVEIDVDEQVQLTVSLLEQARERRDGQGTQA